MTKETPLTEAEASEIGGAIHDLAELKGKIIHGKDDTTKIQALLNFLGDKLTAHAIEFLSAWFTMKHEYEPFLSSQASVMGNVLLILQRRQQVMDARAAAQQPQQAPAPGGPEEEKAPGNVVPLFTR